VAFHSRYVNDRCALAAPHRCAGYPRRSGLLLDDWPVIRQDPRGVRLGHRPGKDLGGEVEQVQPATAPQKRGDVVPLGSGGELGQRARDRVINGVR
jgi:hypothetical protein